MNADKDKLFEEHLRRAEPAPVDDLLVERIGLQIRESESAGRSSRWTSYLGWGSLVAAATVMVAVGLTLFTAGNLTSPDPAVAESSQMPAEASRGAGGETDTYQPVLAENNLKDRIDEGIVFLDGGLTARKYRYQFIDTVVWKNPTNGARVEMQVPRDEVVLIPVQTY